jgi:hypothetical protein
VQAYNADRSMSIDRCYVGAGPAWNTTPSTSRIVNRISTAAVIQADGVEHGAVDVAAVWPRRPARAARLRCAWPAPEDPRAPWRCFRVRRSS